MPLHPGRQTILVVEKVENTDDLDRKGQPQVSEVITAVPGCKLTPLGGSERMDATTDYSKIRWNIEAPALPAALRVKASSVIRYDDDGVLTGRTLRASYTDPLLGVRDVAEFNVENSWPHYVNGLPTQVSIQAKSEVG